MRNHGNVVVSVSQLGRFLAEQAEALGVAILPETAATKLLVKDGLVRGVRTGDRGRGRDGKPLATFEAGSDVVADLTVLAEGSQGLLTGAAIDYFGLEGANPQIWALGVKEVWRVPRPLRRIVHTMGWPLRTMGGYGEFGGSFIYPMGDDLVSIGFVAGLEARDVQFSVHDVLQEFKTHRLVWKIIGGGERVGWGAKTITEGGYHSLPRRFNAPGLLLVGEGPGLVNVPAAEGDPLRDRVGTPRRRGGVPRPPEGRGHEPRRRARLVRRVPPGNAHVEGALRGTEHAPGVRPRPLRRRRPGDGDDADEGPLAERPHGDAPERRGTSHQDRPGEAYPKPDGRYLFDKLSSVFASGNRTRDDQPSHIQVAHRVRRPVAEAWSWMCPAHVYDIGTDHGDGTVTVLVTPSNCVQCGAISAKGGRLTPPEGGSGPEYTLT